jgi:hypothetical protein
VLAFNRRAKPVVPHGQQRRPAAVLRASLAVEMAATV